METDGPGVAAVTGESRRAEHSRQKDTDREIYRHLSDRKLLFRIHLTIGREVPIGRFSAFSGSRMPVADFAYRGQLIRLRARCSAHEISLI